MMRSVSIDDEDQFEDAEENPSSSTSQPVFRTPSRPTMLNVAQNQNEWTNRATPMNIKMRNSQYSVSSRPTSSYTPGSNVRDSAHRDRLSNLRRRMNMEFGNRELVGNFVVPDFEVDDAMSTMSEAPSLQSWQHRMMKRNDTVVVNASDTMSTCAMSIPSSAFSDNYEHFKSPQPPLLSSTPNVAERVRSQTDPTPPRVQPPPVPSREHVTPPKRIPPPLPPRTPSMRLPDPIAIEVETRIRDSENRRLPTVTEDPVVPTRQHHQSKSTDANLSNIENSTKGHKKSNSLDRGLTLAKTIKSGPFPPASNKSNSLTRREADGEEEARNADAENVIREITTSLANACVENDKLETIVSAASSTISSPSSSSNSHEPKLHFTIAPKEGEELPCTSKSVLNYEAAPIANRYSRSMSNDELKNKDHLSSSFDPITLDVERRLSMKRSGQNSDDRTSISDDNTSHISVARSGIGHAKSFARNSVMYASGVIRGAFKRVRNGRHSEASTNQSGRDAESSDEEINDEGHSSIGSIVRPRKSKKGPFDFEHLKVEQELDNEHTGAVWCIKFSICGRLMATAGQDSILRVWVVRSHLKYFSEMRDKYSANVDITTDPMNAMDNIDQFRPPSSMDSAVNSDSLSGEDSNNLFCSKPFALLKGHTADILDLSWSKNYFILSSGMDRTVKLWHLSRNECLCCFQHIDFVTCVAFLPKDDRYFLSGSLDGKLRLWHIPDKKVAVWNEVQVKFITAITFVKNGKFAVVGTYNGRCYFYTTDQLKYHTVVDVRSTRGKNAKGHKVTGLAVHGDKLLVTSNDSRIRMYDIRDKALTCKFRGVQNDHSQIRAAFSPDGRHIICGSEDKFVYLWRSCDMPSSLSVRKDRNSMWERVRTHNAAVSVAVFAPRPQVFFSMLDKRDKKNKSEHLDFEHIPQSDSITSNGNITVAGHAIVSADLQGVIKVMINRPKQCKVAPAGFSKTSRSSTS
ncbi:unnamed protein product [Caenorhabditis angaria]|uniref:WD repeat-containing protein 44 n=1 Tax=Caenorhabditis angaria TaxID=860376 RepID=A0A9P1NAY9_9PELO|nr:unnamed protein product [Caenorhabditis angaria]